jgi:hypothetical protein
MSFLKRTLITACIGSGILAGSAFAASAAVVCSGAVCWHTHEAYDYPPGADVVVHPDDWRWGPHEHFVFHEHEGRGYWRGGHWIGW